MHLSKFGEKISSRSGILQLMDDLGNALNGNEALHMLGGGNPSHIPDVQAVFRERMIKILQHDHEFEWMVGNYDPPQGATEFIKALAGLLRREYGWDLHPKNIALTNGSQIAFFFLFNMFAGAFNDGTYKKILLPLIPEYIGYVDVGLAEDFFVASKPGIEYVDDHTFKYRIDFDAVTVTDQIGAICVSRPTNPTGNVLTDDEIDKLCELARGNGIPLIIDNAYGTPFPNIIFTDIQPVWNEQTILCMSLSKLGLPGTRTGIIIAEEEIIAAVSGMNAVISLAPESVGAALVLDLVRSREIIRVSQDVIKPHYESKMSLAMTQLQAELDGIDFCIHRPEGAFFLWLWCKELPITGQELYERLKKRGVVVVPGHHFFPGLQEQWHHQHECIRITYAQEEEVVRQGVEIIAEEVRKAYSG